MTDTSRETTLADIRNRLAKATNHPLLKLFRYEHGGGRLFVDGESGARELIADFYSEGNREFYSRAFADIEWLLAECDTLRAQLAETQGYWHETGYRVSEWREKCADLEAQLAKQTRELEIVRAAQQRMLPCPDCRDKVQEGQCERCARQRAEAQLAAREGEIATLTKENDELTRRVTMAEQHPRSAASTNETAPCDCTRHRHCPRCHGAGCISDGPNYSHCIECGHEWRHDQPEASDARPTPVEEGTATGSATKCLSCAALTERLNQLVTSLGMVYHCDPTGDGTAPGWRNHRAEKAEARADTAEAQLRAQGWQR